MTDVVIVSAVRTALGRLGGALKDVQPEELARVVITAAVERADVEPAAVDEVVMGQTKQSADAANIARVAALKAGFPVEVPAYTVMRQCGSGLQAVNNAAQAIRAGDADDRGRRRGGEHEHWLRTTCAAPAYGFRPGNAVLVDPNTESQPRSQPYEVYGNLTMGLTAENLVERYGITARSRMPLRCRARSAPSPPSSRAGSRTRSFPSRSPRMGPATVFDTDEHPRRTSLEALAAAGRSSRTAAGHGRQLVRPQRRRRLPRAHVGRDGARAPRRAARDHPRPRGRRRHPRYMGIGPVPASLAALDRAGLTLADMGLVEINEAFAAQTIACVRELGLDEDTLNVNGGAIALGHPLGCSGARILTTLLHEMRKRGTRYGLAGICIAGGQGMATIIETAG